MLLGEMDARWVSAVLSARGHAEALPAGMGAVVEAYSPGHFCRPALGGGDVEVLHLGCERDAHAHEARLSAYADALAPFGTVGRRRLGAGVQCLAFAPTAWGGASDR